VSGARWLCAAQLFVRPGRSALFLLGFAFAVGVMIALLSVGAAIVEQARDKDLVGGADLVLVPQGADVEVLKLGGVTAMFQTVPNARFLHRQLLMARGFLATCAPTRRPGRAGPCSCARGRVIQSLASAGVPSLEHAAGVAKTPASWRDTEAEARFAKLKGEDLYAEMDHWHRPVPGQTGWAEWYYFNLVDPASGRYAYLSFFVAGDPWSGAGIGSLSVQVGAPGTPPVRYVTALPIDSTAVPLDGVGAHLGPARVTFERGRYVLAALRRPARQGRGRVNSRSRRCRAPTPPVEARATTDSSRATSCPPRSRAPTAPSKLPAARGRSRTRRLSRPQLGHVERRPLGLGPVQSADHAFALVYGAVHAGALGPRAGGSSRC
jgi:hypothetical protein